MNPSVSLILPVRDMENGLRDRVQSILEVLSELTPDFDLLIVDHGSRDETRDVAMDLVREYPQVDFLDKPEATDRVTAVEAGIHRTCGEIIFVHDPATPFGAGALHSLWRMRDDADLVMAQSRSTRATRGSIVNRGGVRRPAFGAAGGCLQMIRRCALPPSRRNAPAKYAVDRVTRTDLLSEPLESAGLPKLLARLRRMTQR